jgi:hypothetical protein
MISIVTKKIFSILIVYASMLMSSSILAEENDKTDFNCNLLAGEFTSFYLNKKNDSKFFFIEKELNKKCEITKINSDEKVEEAFENTFCYKTRFIYTGSKAKENYKNLEKMPFLCSEGNGIKNYINNKTERIVLSYSLNEELSNEDKIMQRSYIKKLKSNYLYNEDVLVNDLFTEKTNSELNDLFTHFIMLGFNDAADLLWNNERVDIDVNRKSSQGTEPLMAAAMSYIDGGNVEYAKILIDNGALIDIYTPKNKISIASIAAIKDNYKIVSILIENNSVNLNRDEFGLNILDYIKRNNSIRTGTVFQKLVENINKSKINEK